MIQKVPGIVLCTSQASLHRELEHAGDDECIAIPAFLARKLVREADTLERTRLALLWVILAAVLTVGLIKLAELEREPHERAHPGEQL